MKRFLHQLRGLILSTSYSNFSTKQIEGILDVKSAFLNDYLEEVYIEQPPRYIIKGEEDKVYRLKKALYGLKQAPRAWNTRIYEYFQNNGFVKSLYEHALYTKRNEDGDIMIVCLYMDE